jgi:hypothetical protein
LVRKSTASVVPIKLEAAEVPVLPEVVHPVVVESLLLKVFQSVLEITPAVTPAVLAIGIFNVCAEPAEDQLGAVPLVPGVAKVCVATVIPFNDERTP